MGLFNKLFGNESIVGQKNVYAIIVEERLTKQINLIGLSTNKFTFYEHKRMISRNFMENGFELVANTDKNMVFKQGEDIRILWFFEKSANLKYSEY